MFLWGTADQEQLRPSCSLPSDSVEKAQRREGGAYVHGVQQDETKSPLHALFSTFGHESWDPQDAAAETSKTLQEALLPLFTDQVLEGPLHHWRVHGHQVGPKPHILRVLLHRCQVTPWKQTQQVSVIIHILTHLKALYKQIVYAYLKLMHVCICVTPL